MDCAIKNRTANSPNQVNPNQKTHAHEKRPLPQKMSFKHLSFLFHSSLVRPLSNQQEKK
jgi:hypothetical protein